MKPILCLDFDGVCHSYTSGWQGASVAADPPTEGMWEFLAEAAKAFEIHIYSSRSSMPGGRDTMFSWFMLHANTPEEEKIAALLKFPMEKPPAFVTLDDRVICFTGVWPSITELKEFKPWTMTSV